MTVWGKICKDFEAAKRNDPAIPDGIRGFFEVLFCTPGFLAITAHRGIHFLHSTLHIPVLPRILSLFVRWWTGIEIHPGAEIAEGFFIDHGSGVVIGETSIVGRNVTMYQGVTLGGTGNEKSHKRHPTVGDNVFIGSGAKILGPITVGSYSRIGANSVVLKNVPERATVTGMRARLVKVDGKPVSVSPSAITPEVMLERIIRLEEEIHYLREDIKRAHGENAVAPEPTLDEIAARMPKFEIEIEKK